MRAEPGGRRGVAVLAVVVAVAAVAVVGATAMGGDPSGEAILNDTRERYANADTVVGTADVTVDNGSEAVTATVEFVAAGDRSRVVATKGNETYRAGNNGTVAWYVGPSRTGAWEGDAIRRRAGAVGHWSDATGPDAVLNRTAADHEDVSVELLRSGSDDGTDAYVLRAAPENESEDSRVTLWIAKGDSRLLRVEATDGENATVVDFRETRFNVSVHESTFDPPDDRITVTSVERYGSFASAQAATDLGLPRLDATFREATRVRRAGETAVVQRYVAGGDNVSLIAATSDRSLDRSDAETTTATVNGHDATVMTRSGATVVYWRTDGATIGVVVDADGDRALELARRVEE